jgi:c-di-GMP-related signal transduction protein
MTAREVVVGRQPIFDRELAVMGYELLFRPIPASPLDSAGYQGNQMTAEVVLGSMHIGIDQLVGNKRLFCNASRGVLVGEVPIILPPQRTVVEILETIVPDAEVLAGCERLLDHGFSLALDDISTYSDAQPFLDVASIIKIDIRATSRWRLPALVRRCRRHDVTLIAEKVETFDELRRCGALGFDFFQGYLLARPVEVSGRSLDPSRVTRIRLAAKLLDRECPFTELEEIVRFDPAVSYQLLRLASIGAAHGLRRTVSTLREALVLLGWRRIQAWASLLLLGQGGGASDEALAQALTRARMCELLATRAGALQAELAFTAGLLSSFDLLLDVDLECALRDLPLDAGLRAAVLGGQGHLGQLVAVVKDFQVGQPERAIGSGEDEAALAAIAAEAMIWAVGLSGAFSEAWLEAG